MKVLIFAAHPDDAEVHVGGSICRYVDHGHSVHVINMTNNHTARVDCAERAGEILGFTHEFLDFAQADGAGEKENADLPPFGIRYDAPHFRVVLNKLLEHRPDRVWAHWPVDTHPDHVGAGTLVLRACDHLRLKGERMPELWFFPATFGYQSLCAAPDHFEDVTEYIARKRLAVAEYQCVNIFASYPIAETAMKFFGYQSGFAYAEAFVKCHFRVGDPRYKVIGEGIP